VDRAAHVVDVDHAVGDARAPERGDAIAQRRAAGSASACVPSFDTVKRTSRRVSAIIVIVSTTPRHSERAPRKNFWRAGAL
jgi:hypothetical protein